MRARGQNVEEPEISTFNVVRIGCCVLSLSVLPVEIHAQSDSVIVERDVPAKMRDGVVLKADIYRPRADGKYPVLLQRTPYDKNNTRSFGMKAAAAATLSLCRTRPRPFHFRGRVVSLPPRIAGRLRHRGNGGRAAAIERQSWHVRRLLRSAPPRCSPQSPARRTFPASLPA